MSKTSFSKSLLLLFGVVLIASGCSGNSSTTTASPNASAGQTQPATNSNASKSGGEFIFGLASTLDTLDTGTTGGDDVFRIARSVFDSLVVSLPDQTIKPWLADSWEISTDQKTYTFKLKKGVTFHDGTPFNAQAVKFNFDRIVDPKNKSISAVQLLGTYASSEIIDDYTIRVQLKSPFVPLLSNLGKIGFISPAALQQYGDQIGQHVVGTGPFKLAKWVANTEIQLERNTAYNWPAANAEHTGPAYLDKVTIKFIPEEATRIGSLQSNQVSAAESIPAQNVQALKSDANFQLFTYQRPGLPYSLFFDTEKAPWNDVRVRQAIKYAIDTDTIVKTLYLGAWDRAWSSLSPSVFAYDASLENSYKLDLEKANSLLDEAGWKLGADGIREKDGKKLTLLQLLNDGNREKRLDIATIIQQQLKKIGVKSDLASGAPAQVNDLLRDQKFDVFGMSWNAEDPDVLRTLYHSNNIPADFIKPNVSRLNNAEVNQWLDAAFVETDRNKRAELYKKVQQYVIQNVVSIPVYVMPYTIAAEKKVKDLKIDASGFPLFYDTTLNK